ncbi:hypothetical protein BOTBODRAFT_45726 [Botryobasidium botryosum FD-172 SS1]|uniref:Uncharacterized protein n=1 Tax=Botryobasidium botryosum (strain FD-172 SS1) TaxID=930990 RepID=A0A067MA08_BOTB1|nr:hypothetical protein BOTBODRAFT_45726 [Botryobasidium botryosum FD-172 SS1]
MSSTLGSPTLLDAAWHKTTCYSISKAGLNTLWMAASRSPFRISWVKTDLGGEDAPGDVGGSVSKLLELLERARMKGSGTFVDNEGERLLCVHSATFRDSRHRWRLKRFRRNHNCPLQHHQNLYLRLLTFNMPLPSPRFRLPDIEAMCPYKVRASPYYDVAECNAWVCGVLESDAAVKTYRSARFPLLGVLTSPDADHAGLRLAGGFTFMLFLLDDDLDVEG